MFLSQVSLTSCIEGVKNGFFASMYEVFMQGTVYEVFLHIRMNKILHSFNRITSHDI